MRAALMLSVILMVAAATPPARGAEALEHYRIGPGDVVRIEFFGNPELDRKVRVLHDGTVSLPLLGSVELAGMTLLDAQERIATSLAEQGFVRDPQVTMFVEEFQSRRVYVQGAVAKPGVYEMIGSGRLLEMIAEAGGLAGDNERPDRTIYVIRTGADGEQHRIEVDTRQLVEEANPEFNIQVLPGDVIVVPHAEIQQVYVTGAVTRPGQIEYSSADGITVLQAVTAAGGPTERANLEKVYVLRRGADGSQQRIQVNLKRIRRGKDDDVPLRNNDTVDVGEHFF